MKAKSYQILRIHESPSQIYLEATEIRKKVLSDDRFFFLFIHASNFLNLHPNKLTPENGSPLEKEMNWTWKAHHFVSGVSFGRFFPGGKRCDLFNALALQKLNSMEIWLYLFDRCHHLRGPQHIIPWSIYKRDGFSHSPGSNTGLFYLPTIVVDVAEALRHC